MANAGESGRSPRSCLVIFSGELPLGVFSLDDLGVRFLLLEMVLSGVGKEMTVLCKFSSKSGVLLEELLKVGLTANGTCGCSILSREPDG